MLSEIILRRLHQRVTPRRDQIMLSNLQPLPGSHIRAQRIGRGGKGGGSSGRGNGGQKHHAQAPQPWFTGLYTNPIIEALPRWNWAPRQIKPRLKRLNLDRLQHWLDIGRLSAPASGVITMRELEASGILIGRIRDGVKLMGAGAEFFRAHNLQIEVTQVSKSAIEAIESRGGRVSTVYHTRLGLDQLIRPWRYPVKQPFARPIQEKDIQYYSSLHTRGYLSDRHVYETVFKPRGYIADAETERAFDQECFRVDEALEVDAMPELLEELKKRREWRQFQFDQEQLEIAAKKEAERQQWADQKWFPGQGDWKWVDVDSIRQQEPAVDQLQETTAAKSRENVDLLA